MGEGNVGATRGTAAAMVCLTLGLAACGLPGAAAPGPSAASSATANHPTAGPTGTAPAADGAAASAPAARATFWGVIDGVQGLPLTARVEAIEVRLQAMSPAELEAYLRGYVDAHRRLDTWRHWGAASAFLGFVSDDVFFDVRGWVILHGSRKYEQFLNDPDSLGTFGLTGDGEEISEGELLDYAPTQALRQPGGAKLQARDDLNVYSALDEPSGEPLPDGVPVRELFPKNAAAGEGQPWYLPDEMPEEGSSHLAGELPSAFPGATDKP